MPVRKKFMCTWSTLLLFGVVRGDNPADRGDTPSNDLRLLLRRLAERPFEFSLPINNADPPPRDVRRLLALFGVSCGDNPADRGVPSNDLRLLLRRLAERPFEFSLSIDWRRLFNCRLGDNIIMLLSCFPSSFDGVRRTLCYARFSTRYTQTTTTTNF